MPTVPLSLRVSPEVAARLDRLAAAVDRSRSWLLEQALEQYLEAQSWQVQEIEQGMAELSRGEGIDNGEVAAWLGSWGKRDERDPPR